MPEINNLYKEHKNDVEVVGIQLVGLDSVDDGKNFVKDTSISYAVGSDPDCSISVAYGVSGFPTTFFIDSKGDVYLQKKKFSKIQKVMFSKLGREL